MPWERSWRAGGSVDPVVGRRPRPLPRAFGRRVRRSWSPAPRACSPTRWRSRVGLAIACTGGFRCFSISRPSGSSSAGPRATSPMPPSGSSASAETGDDWRGARPLQRADPRHRLFPVRKPAAVEFLGPPEPLRHAAAGPTSSFSAPRSPHATRGMIDPAAFAADEAGGDPRQHGPGAAGRRDMRSSMRLKAAGSILPPSTSPPTSPRPRQPAVAAPRLIITPHVGGQSSRRIDAMTDFFCDNLRRYLRGQALRQSRRQATRVSRAARLVRPVRGSRRAVAGCSDQAPGDPTTLYPGSAAHDLPADPARCGSRCPEELLARYARDPPGRAANWTEYHTSNAGSGQGGRGWSTSPPGGGPTPSPCRWPSRSSPPSGMTSEELYVEAMGRIAQGGGAGGPDPAGQPPRRP